MRMDGNTLTLKAREIGSKSNFKRIQQLQGRAFSLALLMRRADIAFSTNTKRDEVTFNFSNDTDANEAKRIGETFKLF